MKKLLNVLVIVIIVISLFSIFVNAAKATNYQWKIQHLRPIGTAIDKDVNWLVDEIKERSNGRINITIYPASQLGDYGVVQERVGMGDVEMQLACLSPAMNKKILIMVLPYIVSNWEEARKLYGTGNVVSNILADLLEEQNIKLISEWPFSFGGIGLKKLPPEPADPDVPKKMKLRSPPIRSFELVTKALGYQATTIPFSDAFTALQTGIVDGIIGSGPEGYYSMFRDVINYYLGSNDNFQAWYFYMNLDLWNSLSEEDQQLIQKLGLELEEKRFAVAEEDEKYNLQRLRDYGIEVITFTDEELGRFAKKAREDIWPLLKEDIGPELVNEILAETKNF